MKNKSLIRMILCFMLAFCLCLCEAEPLTAATPEIVDVVEEVETPAVTSLLGASAVNINNGATVNTFNLNGSAGTVYQSTVVSKSTTFTYYVNMPSAGTFALNYAAANGSVYPTVYTLSGSRVSTSGSATINNEKFYYYAVGAGKYRLDMQLYPNSGYNAAAFFLPGFLPAGVTVPTNDQTYFCGNTASNTSTFKINVPASGYLTLAMADVSGSTYSVKVKTSGFADYEYLSSSANTTWIAVKKGTYTFTTNTYAPIYGVKAKFTKVKEGKYGKKKSKAVTLKKKKTAKGLIITNGKKAHWYKFKNTKTKKVKLTFKTSLSGGGGYGGIKITVYGPRNSFTKYIYSGTGTTTIQPYTTTTGNKLAKGTYRIIVESYKNGTGYFTLKWK